MRNEVCALRNAESKFRSNTGIENSILVSENKYPFVTLEKNATSVAQHWICARVVMFKEQKNFHAVTTNSLVHSAN